MHENKHDKYLNYLNKIIIFTILNTSKREEREKESGRMSNFPIVLKNAKSLEERNKFRFLA